MAALLLRDLAQVATPAAGSRTAIEIADVQFDQKLDPDLFTQRYLERGGR